MLKRLGFLLLSTAVLIFFSEKLYWYTDGYAFPDLLLGYALVVWWSVRVMVARLRREQRAADESLAHAHTHGRLGGAS